MNKLDPVSVGMGSDHLRGLLNNQLERFKPKLKQTAGSRMNEERLQDFGHARDSPFYILKHLFALRLHIVFIAHQFRICIYSAKVMLKIMCNKVSHPI